MACVSIGYVSCPIFGMAFVEHSFFQWEERTLNPVLLSKQYSLIKNIMVIVCAHNQLEDPRKIVHPQTEFLSYLSSLMCSLFDKYLLKVFTVMSYLRQWR